MLHRDEVLREARQPMKELIEACHEEVRRTGAELRIGLASGSIPVRDAPPSKTAGALRTVGASIDGEDGSQQADTSTGTSAGALGSAQDDYHIVLPSNAPPTAGRIVWSRSLQSRVDDLVLPLKSLMPAVLHQDEMQIMLGEHAELSKQLSIMQQDDARAWALSLEESV